MFTLFRWLVRLISGLLALIVLAGVAIWYFAARSLPDYNATYSVGGISAPVEIVRSTEDVPHIFGANDEDAYFALGLAHAQDRLWQMTVLRRTVQGRLSEVFGASTLRTDELMRRLDLYGAAVKSVEAQDAPTRAALEAYARGVNAWIEQVNSKALGRGAPEFFVFDAPIAYWTPADSIAIQKLLAAESSPALQNEVLRARISLLGQGWVNDILPDMPGQSVPKGPEYGAIFPTVPKQMTIEDTEAPMSPFPSPALTARANAFAAAARRSAAGGTLLANDPQMGFTTPSWWYLARLQLKSGGVIGATIPGIPFILTGRSETFGWGIAPAYVDDQDLHVEELNPSDPTQYRTPGGWKPFETRRTIIEVKDAQPVTITLRWSDNGPVLPPSHFNLAAVTPPGAVMSLSWTALSESDTTLSAMRALMQAGSIDAAVKAGAGWVAPAMDVVLGDQKSVGRVTMGAIPRRDPRNVTFGRMPSPGWLPEDRWQGTLPYDDTPRDLSPQDGVAMATDAMTVNRSFPGHVSYDWGDSQRIQRLSRLMGEREVHSRESFMSIQLDTVSQAARSLLPLVGKDLWYTGAPAPEGTPERMRQQALGLLAAWDGDMNEHLPEPLIYAAWMKALQNRIIRDELGPLASEFDHLDPLFIERVFRNTDGAARWCDVLQSAPVETCTDMARMALDDALMQLKAKYGPDLQSWRWGDAHEARQDHPLLGRAAFLNWFVNIRQSVSGGDFTLARSATAGDGADPFAAVAGAGYRGVYDFADPDSSVFITATGQSGNPLSGHYDDLAGLWRRGEYIPMSLDPELAHAAAAGITRLEPTTP